MTDVTADEQRQPVRPDWRAVAQLGRVGSAAALRAYRAAKTWHVSSTGYGAAGMLLISASAGLRFGLWAGLGLLGVCCLRIDVRR
jgi:hypothetical protein